jgi:outer membrane lipoprotein-sorting protein
MKKLTVVLILIAGVASGCNKESERSARTATPDPKASVIEASRKFFALKALSANIDGVGQTSIKQHIEYAAPDRYRVDYVDGTGAAMEMIIIGDQSYLKSGDSWTKTPTGQSSIPTLRAAFSDEALKTVSDVKFEGEQTVDGKPAFVYSYKMVTPIGNLPVALKMWVAKNSGLPMRTYVENSSGVGVVKNMTVTYDTESPVTIESPIK